MGRRSTSGYGHFCTRYGHDDYEIGWLWDRYYSGQRIRYPQTMRRWTDEKGARRFCKKWGVKFPGEAS